MQKPLRTSDLDPEDRRLIAECIQERRRIQRLIIRLRAELNQLSDMRLAEKFGVERKVIRWIAKSDY